jgi:NAD(P)-dependent dehydrogenase (short-subunit alcohol dehydrogenase family)
VVNVISVGAFLFGQYTSMYAAGKGGLLTMTRYMASEFAGDGIRVNALAPGSVDTDMVRANPPEAVERMAAASRLGRLASPDEMVGPVLFLASDASSYMTGQVLVVDGGLAAY